MECLYDPNSNNYVNGNFYANNYHPAMAAFYLNGRSNSSASGGGASIQHLMPHKPDYNDINTLQFAPNTNYSNINSPNNVQKSAPYFALTPPLSISSNLSSTPSSCSSTSSINASSSADYIPRHSTSLATPYNAHYQFLQHSPVDTGSAHLMMLNQNNASMHSRNRSHNLTHSKEHISFATSTPSITAHDSSAQQISFEASSSSSDLDGENNNSSKVVIKSPRRMSENVYSTKSASFITPSLMSIEVCQRRKRRQRTQFSKYQLSELEKLFHSTRYPDIYCREDLSARIGIPESRIQVWFKNRRSKIRKDEKTDNNLLQTNFSNEEDYDEDERQYQE